MTVVIMVVGVVAAGIVVVGIVLFFYLYPYPHPYLYLLCTHTCYSKNTLSFSFAVKLRSLFEHTTTSARTVLCTVHVLFN